MATATLPTIKLNMHQRTAINNERTHRHYIMVYCYGHTELLTAKQAQHDQWYGWERVANVEVELPEIVWGSAEEVANDIHLAAMGKAMELGLIPGPENY